MGIGNTGNAPARLARLDGLRGAAAAGVVIHHLFYHLAAWPRAPEPLRWLTDWLWHSGWMLVDLFFVLSGYVFAHVYGVPGRLRQEGALLDFWVARIARLWPLHLVMLALFAIFAWGPPANTAATFVAHLAMMQGFVAPVSQSFDNASWSLSIELACYALFCAGAWAGDRVLLRVSLGLAIGAAWWLALVGEPGGPWVGDVLPRGLMGFFLGQLLWRVRGMAERVPGAALVVLLMAGFALQVGHWSPLLPLGWLAWPAALVLALRAPFMEGAVMRWLGDRSYGLYLVNMGVIRAADALIAPGRLGWAGRIALELGCLVTILIASEAAYRVIEVPARRALRGIWGGRGGRSRARGALPACNSGAFR